jgi:alpha-glucosidase
MPWNGEPKGGFTSGEPWLTMGKHRRRNVAAQREDPGSVLNLTRELIALKKRLRGPYEPLPAPEGGWRYRRDGVVVDLDFKAPRARIEEA